MNAVYGTHFVPYISSHQLVCIVDGGHSCLSLGDEGVVIGVVGDEQHFCQKKGFSLCEYVAFLHVQMCLVGRGLTQKLRFLLGQNLVEDVIVSFSL